MTKYKSVEDFKVFDDVKNAYDLEELIKYWDLYVHSWDTDDFANMQTPYNKKLFSYVLKSPSTVSVKNIYEKYCTKLGAYLHGKEEA